MSESVVTCDVCRRPRKASSMLMTESGGEVCRFCVRAVGANPIKLKTQEPRRRLASRTKREITNLTARAAGLRKYGMTLADFQRRATDQGGACAICGTVPDDPFTLHVDHDHGNGAVRGLLCSACNTGIGMLGDDAVRLRTAARYLERTGQPQPPSGPLQHNGSADDVEVVRATCATTTGSKSR